MDPLWQQGGCGCTGQEWDLGKVSEGHIPAGIREVSQHQLSSLCLALLENGSGSRARAQLLEKAPK